ncbi:hypothetical protein P3T18_003123 [Paraburkholderia sp. GAS199]|uniref:hypothetical protein n=1 Tax=Paraburkholderia sp. GAS199 TaxID=3035126 RepID=UPI003D1D26B4
MEDEWAAQLRALKMLLEIGQRDIVAGRYGDAFKFLNSLEGGNSSNGDGVPAPRCIHERRIGVAKSKFNVPDNIDQTNDEIGKLFEK